MKTSNNYLFEVIDSKEALIRKYLPANGDGVTVAEQLVTAVNKIVYRWTNDGDVYDNTNITFDATGDSACACANWLYENIPGTDILDEVFKMTDEEGYESILSQLMEKFINEGFLELLSEVAKVGSIYHPLGNHFSIVEYSEEDEY